MASTLLPTKMEGTQGLEVGSRTWVDCVLHVTCLSWVPCVWRKLTAPLSSLGRCVLQSRGWVACVLQTLHFPVPWVAFVL